MISNPEYIHWLRKETSLSHTMTLIQLSAIGVGFYQMKDLALRLNVKRPNLNNNLIALRDKGLLGYRGVNSRGTYLYWIKQDFSDKPIDPPGWLIKDTETDWDHFVELGDLMDFATAIKVSPNSIRRLVNGEQETLLGRYKCVSKPIFSPYREEAVV